MTEPTHEVNFDKLESLSIADLTGLITLFKLYPNRKQSTDIIMKTCVKELEKRVNDIIIF